MKKETSLTSIDDIKGRVLTLRNQPVLLDRDVAAIYGVETRALNQAVKRNQDRFPEGYIFQLNDSEYGNWKSQIVTSNLSLEELSAIKMGVRRAPYAFTEKGLYMLATILKSPRATAVGTRVPSVCYHHGFHGFARMIGGGVPSAPFKKKCLSARAIHYALRSEWKWLHDWVLKQILAIGVSPIATRWSHPA